MKCLYCHSRHNEYSCPNCGAPAPELPKQEGERQKQTTPPRPAYDISKIQEKAKKTAKGCIRAAGIFFGIYVLLIVIVVFYSFRGSREARQGVQPLTSQSAGASASPAPTATPDPTASPVATPYPGSEAYLTLIEADYRAAAAELTNYDGLLRYPDEYRHNDYWITLRVAQLIEGSTGITYFRCYALGEDEGSSYWDNPEYLIADMREADKALVFSGDHITVYGDADGLGELHRSMGGVDSVPLLNARYIDIQAKS